ncbi:MAG: hypothetical protein AAFV53_01815 [Myxococcota bacterium]
MPDEPLRVQLAGEDAAHGLLLQRLTDTVLKDALYVKDLNHLRVFVDASSGGLPSPYFSTRNATGRLKEERGIRPGRPYYRSRRLFGQPVGTAAELVDAVDLILLTQENIAAILLLVDEDGSPTRVADVQRAQRYYDEETQHVVILGLCVPTAEGWLVPIIGQVFPERAARLKRILKFDPLIAPERLTSKPRTKDHHAKRVLNALLDEAGKPLQNQKTHTPPRDRVEDALIDVHIDLKPLIRLTKCGLGGFIAALQQRLVPLVESRSTP